MRWPDLFFGETRWRSRSGSCNQACKRSRGFQIRVEEPDYKNMIDRKVTHCLFPRCVTRSRLEEPDVKIFLIDRKVTRWLWCICRGKKVVGSTVCRVRSARARNSGSGVSFADVLGGIVVARASWGFFPLVRPCFGRCGYDRRVSEGCIRVGERVADVYPREPPC